MSLAAAKAAARRELRQRRDQIPLKQRAALDQRAARCFFAWLNRREDVGTVLSFLAFGSEPNLSPLLVAAGVSIAVPRILPERRLMFHQWQPDAAILKNRHGIPEPLATAPPVLPGPGTIVLVPALAIDRHGHRLGYGGGYYDRLLSETTGLITVGICYAEFCYEHNLGEAHDQVVQWRLNESGLEKVPAESARSGL